MRSAGVGIRRPRGAGGGASTVRWLALLTGLLVVAGVVAVAVRTRLRRDQPGRDQLESDREGVGPAGGSRTDIAPVAVEPSPPPVDRAPESPAAPLFEPPAPGAAEPLGRPAASFPTETDTSPVGLPEATPAPLFVDAATPAPLFVDTTTPPFGDAAAPAPLFVDAASADTPPFGLPAVPPVPGAADATDPGLRLPAPAAAATVPGLLPPSAPVGGWAAAGAHPVAATPPPAAAPQQTGTRPAPGPAAVALATPPHPVPPYVAPPHVAAPYPAHPHAAPPHAAPPPAAAPPGSPGTLQFHPPHRWGLGAYLLAELVFLLVSAGLGLVLVGLTPIPPAALAAAIAVPTLAAATVAVVITYVRGNGPFQDLRLRWNLREFGLGLAFGFGGLFVSLPAAAVYVSVVGDDASSAVGDVFGGITTGPGTALLIAATVVLVAPLCEEILYRGLLWGGLTRLGANRWVAFGVTTVIFALAHFEFQRAVLLLVVALPIGLARIYTDGLLAPIVAHQINNLLPGIGLYLMLTGAFPAL